MEVAIGVEVGISNEVLESNQINIENINKENEVNDDKVDVLQVENGAHDDPLLTHEDVKSPVNEGLTTSVSPEINVATKKVGSSKVQKDIEGRNGNKKNPRAGLSHSISFPTRGSIASTLKKSGTFVKKPEGDVKKHKSSNSEHVNGGVSARPSARLTDGAKKLMPVKSVLVDDGSPSDSIKSNNGDMKPLKQTVSGKNDDETNSNSSSINSSGMPRRRSTGAGFSFRLDERAERRREFFSKIEQKIHAKELETTNLQEKSKESQEAEIRRLRKSLTFKATPLPNFYQEPGPPKVELKKIPPTRARSPKLGRNKSSTAAAPTSSSNSNISSITTRPTKPNTTVTNGTSTTLKKPAQKSLAKLPSQKSTTTKCEAKPEAKPKSKISNQNQEPDKIKEEESNNKTIDKEPETEIHAKIDEGSETILNVSVDAPNEEIMVRADAIKVPVEN